MDAFQSHKSKCTNVTEHNLSVRKSVLPAWVKAAVSMGELPVHHYGPMSHPMSCNPPTPTPTLTQTHITTPSNKQVVTSLDSQSLVVLQSSHDELSSLSQLFSQPEQERADDFASEEKCQQPNTANDTNDEDTYL